MLSRVRLHIGRCKIDGMVFGSLSQELLSFYLFSWVFCLPVCLCRHTHAKKCLWATLRGQFSAATLWHEVRVWLSDLKQESPPAVPSQGPYKVFFFLFRWPYITLQAMHKSGSLHTRLAGNCDLLRNHYLGCLCSCPSSNHKGADCTLCERYYHPPTLNNDLNANLPLRQLGRFDEDKNSK